MNKILVTGMALGAEPEIDVCDVCNYDIEWLFRKPSTLLWTDKIILTPKIYETIKSRKYPDEKDKISEAIHIIFEHINDHGLIEIKNPADIISTAVRDNIFEAIEQDKKLITTTFPDSIKPGSEGVPGEVIIEGNEYCTPVLWTLYASLMLAEEWQANILYQDKAFHYFKYKFGINPKNLQSQHEKHKAFDEIFSTFVPETALLPSIWGHDPKCKTCAKETQCEAGAAKLVEQNIKQVLEWRNYDELFELREVITNIAKSKNDGTIITAEELIAKFEKKEQKLMKNLHRVFPKIQQWSNVVTILSLPMVVAGLSTGSNTISSVGGAIAGISTATNKYLELAKAKYRWLGFRADALRAKPEYSNKTVKKAAGKKRRAS